MEILIDHIDEIKAAARKFVAAFPTPRTFTFDAPMGTGKTTFIRAVCQELGVQDTINSPTFSIINEYKAEQSGLMLYHLDCYRLTTAQEAIDIGVEEYIGRGYYCFIEWPEVLASLLPADAVHVTIREQMNGSRRLQINPDSATFVHRANE